MATVTAAPAHGLGDQRYDRAFFGHPIGLSTLFFTEMWERFSYYGMRAFLVLYMTASVATGGMGIDTATAAVIYGIYTSSVYLMNIPGGWLADKVLGQRRAVLIGGMFIAAGHFSLALPSTTTFFVGLLLIIVGTGLLKPNISVIVGQLYGAQDVRRDSAFSIFYMGINLGAWGGPLACGFLVQSEWFRNRILSWGLDPNSAWHWGFGAAGVGMTLGLLQYLWQGRKLGEAGIRPVTAASPEVFAQAKRQATTYMSLGVLVLAIFAFLVYNGTIVLTKNNVTAGFSVLLFTVTAAIFGTLFANREWTSVERKRFVMIGVYFIAAAFFWSVFEQAGSTLTLFADRSTDNRVFGHAFPSTWWQSVNSMMIFALAPVFAWLWITLGKKQPGTPAKFGLGLIGVGLGFLILIPGAQTALTGVKAGPMWLFLVYLMHTLGELCLSPVGLSAMTKLAPAKVMSLVMGIWFLGASIGNFLGGQAASFYETLPLPRLLFLVSLPPIALGIGMLLFRKKLEALQGGIR